MKSPVALKGHLSVRKVFCQHIQLISLENKNG